MNTPEPNHRNDHARISIPLLLGAIALSLCACKKEAPAPLPPPIVQVMEVVATNVALHTEFIGQLDSPQNIEIRPRVEAFVQEIPFLEGSEVKQGEVLFKLDDAPYQQRLNAAKAELAQAEATLGKYQTDVARYKPLAEKRAVPQQDLDNALASVEVGKAAVLAAQAQVESAQLDVSYCTITAPTNGLIGAKQVSIGELVRKAMPPLMATMSTLDPIWFYCNVSEVDYLKADAEARRTGKLVRDRPVTLILADGSVHPDTGKFVFIDRAVDVKTGTFRLRAEFANPDVKVGEVVRKLLRPGMFGRIRVDLTVRENSILVPEKALTEMQGNNFVWVVNSDNKAAQRPVKLGPQVGGCFIVVDGLKAGERIIVEGLQKARQDQPVQPMTAAQAAEAAAKAAKETEAKQAEAGKSGEGEAKHGKE